MAFTVAFAELHGYPRSQWDEGEFDAERRLLVAWDDRIQFLNELDVYPNFLYPYGDGPAGATARRAKIVPFGKSTADTGSSYGQYEYAIIQLFHTTRGPQWNTTLGVHIDETLTPAQQYGLVARKNLRWPDGTALNPNDEPRLDDTLYEYTVTYSRLLTVPTWVLTRPGICNSNVVACQVLPIVFAPQTLKYNGATVHVTWSLGRVVRYDVTAHFLFKSSTWNKYWNAGHAAWEIVNKAGGGQYIQHQPVVVNVSPQ